MVEDTQYRSMYVYLLNCMYVWSHIHSSTVVLSSMVTSMYGYHILLYQRMDQPGKVPIPSRGQLDSREKRLVLCIRSRLRIWPREEGSAVPSRVSLPILHTLLILIG